MRILVVDDDAQIVRALRVLLGARGYDVDVAHDGAEALRVASHAHPDLVLLDLGMPGLTGIDVIVGLRSWSRVPILVVSGRTGSSDKVDALDAGADDYVTKPFAPDELLARIRALTRRVVPEDESAVVRMGSLRIDLVAKIVLREDGSEPVRLTPTEWRMLEALVRHPGRLVTREMLLNTVWGPHHAGDSGYLRLYVAQLRKKLEPEPSAPRYLLTEAGMGYRFVPDPAAPPGTPAPSADGH